MGRNVTKPVFVVSDKAKLNSKLQKLVLLVASLEEVNNKGAD